ncbi:hypothetical protein DEU56DRAFT_345526 [Suillus clintonianus]|uniref:uncharacterized protein n=1 Tax=Suillus clintonianus TaxID=1904413 RepID=UPI001B880718|nr:uncharacterized protein DEU56DRAFT_345526 [Suillus clintonianus]KAG2137970.1 hypothetical protein DEU56DRAFT_345526 [Suillus clintonianus]
MSNNTTTPSPAITVPSPPPGTNYIAIIQPSLNSIMIGHTFTVILIPLIIALFYFSTPLSRRRPIFILNAIAIILAFIAGIMIDSLAIHSMLSPLDPWPPTMNIAIGIIGAFQSILVDLILLLRLTLIYPHTIVGPKRFALVTALPILLKIARLVNMFIFIKVLADAARGPSGSENLAVVWATTPYLKIEWSAQLVDNAYASIAFLWAIRLRRIHTSSAASEINPRKSTFGQRLRTLFYIAVSNFVFPSLLSLAQLIVVYKNVYVLTVNEIVLVNTMVAVIGVVFATVWAGSVNYHNEKTEPGVLEKARDVTFDGPGTWKVATAQPSLTMGSTAITERTRSMRGEAIRLVDMNQTSDIFLKSAAGDS